MLALSFLNPALLWLLPLIAVPVIIHLLNRRRFKRVRWAAMEYLLAALRRNRRRLQMQQWLLLLLRTLAVALLVFLVTRPQLTGGVFGAARTLHVLCLDDSLSMTQRSGARDAWQEARDAVLTAVGKLAETRPGDVVTLLTLDAPQRPLLVGQRVGPQLQARVREAFSTMAQAGDGTGELATLLQRARALAAEQTDCARAEIVLYTDCRQVDWLGVDGRAKSDLAAAVMALDQETQHLRVVVLGGRDAENVAVGAVRAKDRLVVAGVPATFEIEVTNRGLSASQPGELTVRFGHGAASSQRTFPLDGLQPGQSVQVAVQHTFREGGDSAVVASIARDAFAADDQRALALHVRAAVRCLLVDGDPGQRPEEAETYYLAAVLSPDLEVITGVDAVVVGEQGLAEEDLATFDIVWLCNVPAPAPPVTERLRAYVAGGGGLVVFTGNQIDPARYAEVLGTGRGGLLPLAFGEVSGDMKALRSAFLADAEHPLVGPEAEALTAILPGVLVGRYHPLVEDAASGVTPIVRVGDARGPGLICAAEAAVAGQGRVVQIGTTADDYLQNGWSHLAGFGPAYVTLCHRISAWAARAQDDASRNLGTRDVYRTSLDPGRFRADVTVRAGGEVGADKTFTAGEPADGKTDLELAVPFADVRGFGTIELSLQRHDGGQDTRLLARNPPLREGELLRFTGSAFQRAYPPEAAARATFEEAAGGAGAESSGGDLARMLAFALLAALLLESLLAFRSSK